MAEDHKKHGVGHYIVVALILGVITYVEFAIVEYDISWLSRGATMFWLIALSVVKFWMVIWFFMHLKEDNKLYTGLFSSGMLIAMGTFVGLSFMFILPNAVANRVVPAPTQVVGHDAHAPAPAEPGDAVPPADRSVLIEPPLAGAAEVELDLADEPLAVAQDAEDPVAAQDAEASAEAPAQDEPAGPPAAELDFDRALGQTVYAANCQSCHQPTGAGLPGIFPPLAGHAGEVAMAEGGREHLLLTLAFGMQGPITVNGADYNGFMPGWAALSDTDVAAVLNHLVAGLDDAPSGFEVFTSAEVGSVRGLGLSPQDVHQRRQALDLP